MPSHQSPLRFQVFRGGQLIAERTLAESSVSIGRAANALLRVDDPSVGDLHAVINVEDDGSVQLLDLGTEAGTVHNGEHISNVVLSSGDSFQIGTVQVKVVFDEREHTTPTMDVRPDLGGVPTVDDVTQDAPKADVDVLDMLIQAGITSAGADMKAPKVLEISHIWGNVLLDTKQFKRGTPVTIGPSFGHKWSLFGRPVGWVPENMSGILSASPPIWSEVEEVWSSDFYVAGELLPNQDDFSIVVPSGNGWIARIDKRWDGFADVGNTRYSLADLIKAGKAKENGNFIELSLEEGTDVAIDIGGVIFFVRQVHPGAKVIATVERDWAFTGIASVCGFIFVLLMAILRFAPPVAEGDVNIPPERLVEMMLQKPPEPPPEEKKKKDDSETNPDAGAGEKAKEEEGKVGKKDAKQDQAKGEKTNSAVQDREVAENAGLLGALSDPNNMLSSGLDASLSSGIGGLIGAKGTQFGVGGLGGRGGGLGGGGTGDGLGGLGGSGSGLGGSGTGKGGGYAGSGGSLGSKGSGKAPSASTGDPLVVGALDRSLIDQVVKSKMSQIRYCYQRELQKDPGLGGKLTVKFTIGKDGSVSAASVKSSTVGSAAVDSCVVQRFYQMKFPEPKGGGIVVVSYPFIFAPG